MSKSKELLESVEEVMGSTSKSDLAVNDMVQYKTGHHLEGVIGMVQDTGLEGNMVWLKVGQALVKADVKDLLKNTNPNVTDT